VGTALEGAFAQPAIACGRSRRDTAKTGTKHAAFGCGRSAQETAMKALVYRGPGQKAVEERPKPAIQAPGDAIVKIVKTTICGTDLHILKGDVPSCQPGRILGHEGVGVVDSVGQGVTSFKPGDRVLISCITPLAAAANIAGGACIRIAPPAAGSSATRSTARRPNMCARRMPIRASFIRFPKAPTKKRW